MAEATLAEQDEATAGAATEGTEGEFFDPQNTGGEEGANGGGEEPQNGNGKKTLADLAAEAPEADKSTEADDEVQPQLFGTEKKVTASIKGPKPKTSHVSFSTAEVDVSGQFGGEDLIEVRTLLQLNGVEIKYRRKGGEIVDTRRVHKAKAIRVEQLNVSPELIMARAQHVADALAVDVHELIAAQETAISTVALPE